MSVRPRQGDEEDPETIEFGIAALAARLDRAEVSFPIRAEKLVRALGDPEIPTDAHGNGMTLSSALDETAKKRFESQQELLNALHPVFESHRNRTSSGVLASIRSLFPF